MENTLFWNRILQFSGHPIYTYVYTSNKKVKEKALEAKCIPREVPQRNAFGLPTLSSILQDLRSVSNCSYIAYINSDIMLNPEIFSLLEFVSNHRYDYNLTQPVYIQLHTKW